MGQRKLFGFAWFVTRVTGLILLFQLLSPNAHGQSGRLEALWQSGSPFITNYTSGDYHAALQNWGIVQGNDGAMYFANNAGVLRFDGARWTIVKAPNNLTIRSIARDRRGNVYVGGNNEIGVLEFDPSRGYSFRSLTNQIDSAYRNFGRVWSTHTVEDTVYFVCSHYLLKLANRYAKVFTFPENEGAAFSWVVENDFYVDVKGRGLLKARGDTLERVSEDMRDIGLTTLLPYAKGQQLVSGSSQKVYLFDSLGITPLIRNHEQVELEAKPYYGIRLRNGDYALATLTSGMYIMDSAGTVKTKISKREGLPSDAIYCIYEDRDGDLWLGTENGISHVAFNSPIRVFNGVHGIDENPADLEFFENAIYVVNSKGLFKSNVKESLKSGGSTLFTKVPGLDNQTTDCFRMQDRLIVANMSGIFSLSSNGVMEKLSTERYVKLEQAFKSGQSDFFYGTLENSIGRISFNGRNVKREVVNMKHTPEELIRTKSNTLLINTRSEIFEISLCDSAGKTVLCREPFLLSRETGKRHVANTSPLCLGSNGDNEIILGQGNVVYRFDSVSHRFKVDDSVTAYLKKYEGCVVQEIIPGKGDCFWLKISTGDEGRVQLLKYSHGKMNGIPALNRLADDFILAMDDTGEGYALIGSNRGVVLYKETEGAWTNDDVGQTAVMILTEKDSVLQVGSDQLKAERLELPYETRDLHFKFSIPAYNMSNRNTFQYKLEGYDNTWTEWSASTQADYTNLSEGTYTFTVRGRDVYQREFISADIKFIVLPPWYRTWWAYGGYTVFLISIVFGLVQWRSYSLRKEHKRLENIIAERTGHIRMQAEKLKEMDLIKTRFFANISHEFRTPLTLIMGPLEMEIRKNNDVSNKNLQLIKRNADRLLELVNQLLDVIKIESGTMTLDLEEDNLSYFLETLCISFESLAQQKQVSFVRNIRIEGNSYFFDHDKLDKICVNLLSNAFKFTTAHQTVTFEASTFLVGSHAWLCLVVSDTGRGIADEEKDKVFQSFYQASNVGEEGGTGLGLSLVQELVTLYHGSVSLESQLGTGTTFRIEIPLDPLLLSPAV